MHTNWCRMKTVRKKTDLRGPQNVINRSHPNTRCKKIKISN